MAEQPQYSTPRWLGIFRAQDADLAGFYKIVACRIYVASDAYLRVQEHRRQYATTCPRVTV
jgi:hypothetical protein